MGVTTDPGKSKGCRQRMRTFNRVSAMPVFVWLWLMTLALGSCARAAFAADPDKREGLEIRVSFGAELSKQALDGRVLVMFSTDPSDEPQEDDQPAVRR
jgi:hypothetical protein